MRTNDEHGTWVFSRGPERSAAHELWRAQRELEAVLARATSDSSETAPDPGLTLLTRRVADGQEAFDGRVFRIPAVALAELRREIKRLGRRARKLGTGSIRLRDTGEIDSGHAFVVLRGEAPVLAGWTLAAIVDHRDEDVTLRPVSEHGARLPTWAFLHPRCEHCGLARRRVNTFVVVNTTDGEARQVGSGCLRDFLGGNDPERACRQAEFLALARGALERADRRPPAESTSAAAPELTVEEFAAHAAHVLRVHGWVSRARARRTSEQATADRALQSLEAAPDAPSRADRALAAAALNWGRALLPTKSTPTAFERDALAVITTGRTLARRERGLICALVAVHRRHLARSHHLGAPGARIEATVMVERVTPQPSVRYGTVHRCELLDTQVNKLVWWQTHGTPLQTGEVLALCGQVERHTQFGSTPVTVLTHCRRETRSSAELPARSGIRSPSGDSRARSAE